MEKQPTVVIGQGAVANAIAGQLTQAGREVIQLALAGGNREGVPLVPVPKQVWPMNAQPVLEPLRSAEIVPAFKVELGLDGQIYLSAEGHPALVPENLIIASSRAAVKLMPQLNLKLPLRPVRCHTVLLKNPVPLEDVTYLSKGCICALNGPARILYDGLIDPRQATFLQVPDLAVQEALQEWLAKQGTEPAEVPAVITTATTPDFLPAFGPWTDLPQLWISVGWHIYGPSVAGSMAAKMLDMMNGNANTDIEISRLDAMRFHAGNWEKTGRPVWLPEHPRPQLVGGLKEVTRADTIVTVDSPTVERGKNVQMVETPTLQRAGKVQMGAARGGRGRVQAAPIKS